MNTIQIDTIKRQFPSSWNELSRQQLLEVSRKFLARITAADFKMGLLKAFLQLKKSYLRSIDAEDVFFLGETLNFLLDANKLTINLIRRIYIKRWAGIRMYCGPDDSMKSCTFGEFIKADQKKDAYSTSKNERDMDALVAILYRPRKPLWFIRRHFTENTDPRRRFIDRTLDKRTDMMKYVPPEIKFAVILFFNGVLESLPEKFPHVFRKKADQDEDTLGWAGLVISLADGKTDDESLNKIMDSNMYNVFLGLEHKALEYYKFKKKYKISDDE